MVYEIQIYDNIMDSAFMELFYSWVTLFPNVIESIAFCFMCGCTTHKIVKFRKINYKVFPKFYTWFEFQTSILPN